MRYIFLLYALFILACQPEECTTPMVTGCEATAIFSGGYIDGGNAFEFPESTGVLIENADNGNFHLITTLDIWRIILIFSADENGSNGILLSGSLENTSNPGETFVVSRESFNITTNEFTNPHYCDQGLINNIEGPPVENFFLLEKWNGNIEFEAFHNLSSLRLLIDFSLSTENTITIVTC